MNNGSAQLVAKLWNYCNLLRDDGLSYGDYVQQLTNLLFLKMAHERTQPPYNRPSVVPEEYGWPALIALDGDALEVHYRHTLEELGKKPGMLGTIFRKAQNKVEDPAKLRRLIADLIDKEQWTSVPVPPPAWRGHGYSIRPYSILSTATRIDVTVASMLTWRCPLCLRLRPPAADPGRRTVPPARRTARHRPSRQPRGPADEHRHHRRHRRRRHQGVPVLRRDHQG